MANELKGFRLNSIIFMNEFVNQISRLFMRVINCQLKLI